MKAAESRRRGIPSDLLRRLVVAGPGQRSMSWLRDGAAPSGTVPAVLPVLCPVALGTSKGQSSLSSFSVPGWKAFRLELFLR